MANISILGTGGWGIALAVMLNKNGHKIKMWSKFPDEIKNLKANRENKKLLPGVKISESIELTDNLLNIINCDIIIIAVPSFAVRQTAELLKDLVLPGTIILNVSKGLEHGTYKRFSQVLEEILPQCKVAVLSGPSHAEEVSIGMPTSLVVASVCEKTASYIQDIMMNSLFRVYVNPDVVGVELGGALKNIIALSVGIGIGLSLGDNSQAALITRGLTEIARLGVKLGAKSETFAGLTGLGDLIVSCMSRHSRNRRAGMLIGSGVSAEDAIKQVGVVEGYYICHEAYCFSREVGVKMPITKECYKILYENKDPKLAIKALMGRPKSREIEHTWLGNN